MNAYPYRSRAARHWWLLAWMLLVPLWSIGLFGRGAWTPDEPREYDIAYNMLQSGDLVTPRLTGQPFLEKPPFSYWTQSASMRLFAPTVWVARIPNLLWAMLTVLCIGSLAGRMAAPRNRGHAALIAALACGTMMLLLQTQIWLATDAPLIAMTAAALLGAWRLAHAATRRQQFTWSLALGASLAAAFLTKNGFALLVPGLAVLGWMLWQRQPSRLLQWRWWIAAGWLMVMAGTWLALLSRQPGGHELLHELLWDNLVGRFLPVAQNPRLPDPGHASSHWKYLLLLPVYTLPWSFALFGAVRWASALSRHPAPATSALRFCMASVALPCLVLLASRTARGVYFAPALLGLPVLLSLWLTQAGELTQPERRLLGLTRSLSRLLGVVLLVLAMLVLALTGIHTLFLLTIPAVALIMVGTRSSQYAAPRAARGIIGGIGVFLVGLATLEAAAFPVIDRSKDLGALVAAAQSRLRSGRVAVYCGDETTQATLDYAIGLRLENVCGAESAGQMLQQHADQQFLVLLPAPRSAQSLTELFPRLESIRWREKPPRPARHVADLEKLGMQPMARWSAPGGRRYALYGRGPGSPSTPRSSL
ncbi:MAG: glycosyltransferase family 39 protein [Steroidobacteraceae bacterium]